MAATTAKKTTTKATTRATTATKKASSPKKATAKTTAAKKTTTRKRTAKSAISPEKRYEMTEVAAYYIAEQHGFQGSPSDYWYAAEAQIASQVAQS